MARLTTQIREVVAAGFQLLYLGRLAAAKLSEGDRKLLLMKKEARIRGKSVKVERKSTQPPPSMSEAELIAALKAKGIGRPATYALIIETLLKRKYVKRNPQGRLEVTTRGQDVYDFLLQEFDIVLDYAWTQEVNTALDQIAVGKASYTHTLTELWSSVKKENT